MNGLFASLLFGIFFGVVSLIALVSTILCDVRACRHNQVEVFRAHPESEFGRQHHGKHAFIDAHGVLNFVQCRYCKRVLNAKAEASA
jgi:hypothetical protein